MKNKLNEKGFTIIEVLIVLAIAGLMMVVVFLAVPALQRNSRNTQRNNDAAMIAAAVNECLANRNGRTASCDATNEISIDTTRLSQLTTIAYSNAQGSLTQANWQFGMKCQDDGSTGTTTGASARQFVVTYDIENAAGAGIDRCIDS